MAWENTETKETKKQLKRTKYALNIKKCCFKDTAVLFVTMRVKMVCMTGV